MELREHLERSQNPVFYYDNDADGLCSYLIFRRFLGRGKGVAVRSYPDLNVSYAKKAQELKADYVFVLDKPSLSREFVDEIDKMHIPLVWIDHHNIKEDNFEKEFNNFYTFNPAKNKGKDQSDEPVTYMAYKVTGRKEDMWLAIMGCASDHFIPDFAEEFGERYPEFWGKVKVPFDIYYKTEIGKIARSLNFGLKDSTTHIVQLQNFLISCNNPSDVFAEITNNKSFREKYADIKRKYDDLIERAKAESEGKIIFFEYSGDLSISGDLSNELSYLNPTKYIVVAYKKEGICNLSMRGKGVKGILNRILPKLEGASGGGHEDAVGARIRASELEKFKTLFEEETK